MTESKRNSVHEGGGIYGPEVEHMLHSTDAQTVIAIIIGGSRGSGFSVSSRYQLDGFKVAEKLRALAHDIEAAERASLT